MPVVVRSNEHRGKARVECEVHTDTGLVYYRICLIFEKSFSSDADDTIFWCVCLFRRPEKKIVRAASGRPA